MDIVVFGAGSLGSLIGGLLASTHDVTLVGRNPHMAVIDDDGLRMEGCVTQTITPTARVEPPDSADLAIVCVKSYDTPDAAAALADTDLRVAVSLQNGMGNEATLASQLGGTVLAGTCTYGALRPAPGVVRCTGIGEVTIGAADGPAPPIAHDVGVAFTDAGIDVTVTDAMAQHLWEKLAVNAGVNTTTALARLENGALADGEAAAVATAAARETAAVAQADGINLTADAAEAALQRVVDGTAPNVSSMHQDIRNCQRTEIDAIGGFVVTCAANYGIEVPVIQTMTRLLRAWEHGHALRTD